MMNIFKIYVDHLPKGKIRTAFHQGCATNAHVSYHCSLLWLISSSVGPTTLICHQQQGGDWFDHVGPTSLTCDQLRAHVSSTPAHGNNYSLRPSAHAAEANSGTLLTVSHWN